MIKESFPNPDLITYHIVRRLTDFGPMSFKTRSWNLLESADAGGLLRIISFIFGGRGSVEYARFERAERKKNSSLVEDIFKIEGVTEVSIGTYEVSVTKGKAYKWRDLEPQIVKILEMHGLDK